MERLKQKNCN